MSIEGLHDVECPKCHSTHQFTIWQSMNTVIDPELKESVRNLSVFDFVCPSCGQTTPVSYEFLYHQMEDKLMIYLAFSEESANQFIESINVVASNPSGMIRKEMNKEYTFRVVTSQQELVEKLTIFDANLDDRIIEILKIFILKSFFEENSQEKNFDKNVHVAFAKGQIFEDDFILYLTKENEYIGETPFSKDYYDYLEKSFERVLKNEREKPFIVDRNWALSAFKTNSR